MRKHWLDNIRWATVVLVVFYHVVWEYNAEGILGGLGKITSLETQWIDLLMYIVYPWFMPLLFIVSGISAKLYLEQHTDREFFKSRTTKLLVPSTIGVLVFGFVQGYLSMAIGGAFDSMAEVPPFVLYLIMCASGIGVLWYIQLLWVFSLVLVIVRKIEKDRLHNLCAKTNVAVLALFAVPVWGAAQIMNTPLIVVYRFGFYGIVFFLGYFVFSHDEVIERLKKWFPLFGAAALALCAVFCICYFGKNIADKPVNRTPLYAAFAWFACLALLGGAARFFDFENAFTKWTNKRSWGLYVFHMIGISAVALYFGKTALLPPVLTYVLSLIAGFAVGYGLNAIISRIPFFRWAILGIKKQRTAAEKPHTNQETAKDSNV